MGKVNTLLLNEVRRYEVRVRADSLMYFQPFCECSQRKWTDPITADVNVNIHINPSSGNYILFYKICYNFTHYLFLK